MAVTGQGLGVAGCGGAGSCLSEWMGMMQGLEVVYVVGVLQLVQKIGAKLGRRPVISSTAYSQFGTG